MNKYVIKLIRPNGRDASQTQRNVHVEAPGYSAVEATVKQMVENDRLHLYLGEFIGSISLAGYH